jgi:hypothetical protein
MIKRLGLVIHWLGFIGSLIVVLIITYGITTYGTEEIDSEEWLEIAATLIGPLGVGWLFRFITVGHRSLLPWNRGSSND